MMRSFSVVILTLLYGLLLAQDADHPVPCQDSLFLLHNDDGAMFLQWQSGMRTSLERISYATGCPAPEIIALNPILRFRDLGACDRILLPFSKDKITSYQPDGSISVYYSVRKGETVFGIANRILQIPVDSLIAMNDPDDHLKPGQLLRVGWLRRDLIIEPIDESQSEPIVADGKYGFYPDSLIVADSTGIQIASEHGVAWWNKSKRDPNLFALHREAPLNSLIEITNPMFGRSVLAKVIGTIPPTYADDIAVIVSQGVAEQLGAIDGRFYVEMRYQEH